MSRNNNKRKADQLEVVSVQLSNLVLDHKHDDDPMEDVTVEKKPELEIVTSITDHKLDKHGNFIFKVNFKHWPSNWIPDAECQCEREIREYFAWKKIDIKTVYAFCRVSTKEQAGEFNISLDGQREEIQKCLKNLKKGLKNYRIKVITHQGSAFKQICEPLRELGEVTTKGDKIVVYSIDRLTRCIFDAIPFLESLAQKEVNVYSVSEERWYINPRNPKDGGASRLHFIQDILHATMESAKKAEKSFKAIERRRERGDHFGPIPFGMKSVRKEIKGQDKNTWPIVLVDNPEEQKVIELIVKSKNDWDEIAEFLNTHGYRKRGRKWTDETVRKVKEDHGHRVSK